MQDGTVAQSCEGTVLALGSALVAVRGCRRTHNDVARFLVWQDAQITVARGFSHRDAAGCTVVEGGGDGLPTARGRG